MASKYKQKIIKEYESRGYLVIGLIRGNANGFADLIAFKEGEKPIFIEVKEKHERISELQLYRGRQVEKYGCRFLVKHDGKGDS